MYPNYPPQGYPPQPGQPYPPQAPPAYPPAAPQPGYPPQGGYQGYPQQPYGPAPGYPQQAPLPRATIADFLDQPAGGSGKSIAGFLQNQGQSITGIVARPITNADIQVQTDPVSRQPAKRNDGHLKYVMVVPLNVAPSQFFPDGRAAWYVRGQAQAELARAMGAVGLPAGAVPEMGAEITITKLGSRPIPGLSAQGIFQVVYRRPAGADGAPVPDGLQQAVPQPPPPAQPAPQYAPPPQPQYVPPAPPAPQPAYAQPGAYQMPAGQDGQPQPAYAQPPQPQYAPPAQPAPQPAYAQPPQQLPGQPPQGYAPQQPMPSVPGLPPGVVLNPDQQALLARLTTPQQGAPVPQ